MTKAALAGEADDKSQSQNRMTNVEGGHVDVGAGSLNRVSGQ